MVDGSVARSERSPSLFASTLDFSLLSLAAYSCILRFNGTLLPGIGERYVGVFFSVSVTSCSSQKTEITFLKKVKGTSYSKYMLMLLEYIGCCYEMQSRDFICINTLRTPVFRNLFCLARDISKIAEGEHSLPK